MELVWYGTTSVIFGVILFFPVRKVMHAMSINRLQRKEQRPATDEERETLRRKVTPWAAAISITFAFFYNKVILLKFLGRA
jgi:hypothetical protein